MIYDRHYANYSYSIRRLGSSNQSLLYKLSRFDWNCFLRSSFCWSSWLWCYQYPCKVISDYSYSPSAFVCPLYKVTLSYYSFLDSWVFILGRCWITILLHYFYRLGHSLRYGLHFNLLPKPNQIAYYHLTVDSPLEMVNLYF